MEFLKSDSFRRIVAAVVMVLVPLLNQKLGMNIPQEQVIAAIVGLAVYIAQGGYKAAQVAKADAHVEAAKLVAAGPSPVAKPTPSIRPPSQL